MALNVKIAGTGINLPGRVVTDTEMDARLQVRPGWVNKKTNVHTRHFIHQETASQMGARAAQKALEAAGLTFGQIDCLVCASATMEQPIPCTAALIQTAMGQEHSGVPAFDVNSTCLSFVTGLDVMSYMVHAGRYKRVLLVSTEVASKGLNWQQKESAALFGDGAAAVVIEQSAGEPSRLLHAAMQTYSSGARYSEIRGGGSALHASEYREAAEADYLFDMNGEAIFRMASRLLPDFLRGILEATGSRIGDYRLVIPHQGSAMAMRLLSRRLGISEEQLMYITPDRGNTIAASIPMGLHEAVRQGRIERGDRVLLLGTSAGFSLGGIDFVY
ncbi:3-oxoacyl-[acyl-carrier-protein] synthase 3 [Paenibacillus solanacearum]|uniref:3-oxoacyl-[acyl-carrier-protein] synthase 3 n=1 Tax=Paenibacillus solanacearum TaxID=2048548 RepID=A0A916K7V9_9BACL|nr:beta-ketoacyl-ACP synthase III [Paenibacillus solanacearum]CAG7642027.1 3-oxoacyl-[acyl-carrier-protein] synthase 3 [Paenibacillus solanacearum]